MIRENKFIIAKRIIALTTPIAGSNFLNMAASVFTIMMVAQLGPPELAAAALSTSTFFAAISSVSTILYAISILVGHACGRKNYEKVGAIIRSGIITATILGLIVAITFWNADKILLLCKQNPTIVALTIGYFHYMALALIPTLLVNVAAQFFMGIGRPQIMMALTAIRLPLMLFLSYVFILGKYGFPQLGLAGAALAILIIQCLSLIVIYAYMFFAKNIKIYQIFSGSFALTECFNILIIGVPIGIQVGGELAAIMFATYFMGLFGVIALAASQVVSQYVVLSVMISNSLGQAVSILVSNAFAEKNMQLINQYKLISIYMIMVFSLCVFTLFIFVPNILMHPFIAAHSTSDSSLVRLIRDLFVVAGFTILFNGVRDVLSGYLRGLHNSKRPMWAGLIGLWMFSLPLAYIVGFVFHEGPIGLRIGFMSGFVVATLLLFISRSKTSYEPPFVIAN